MDKNYIKHSLEQIQEWVRDSMGAEASPQEIYDAIRSAVEEDYYCYKHQTSQAYELLALLNGNGKGHIKAYDDAIDKVLSCDKDDQSPECKNAWTSFWKDNSFWESKDDCMPPWGHSDMEALGKSNHKSVTELSYEDAIKQGWTMTADGFWFPPEKKDKVVKWQLPIEIDYPSGMYFVTFPEDLLEAANLKENDRVEWNDNGDGSYTLRKVNSCEETNGIK